MNVKRLTNPVVIMAIVANFSGFIAIAYSTESPIVRGAAGLSVFLFTSVILEVNRNIR